MTEADNRKTIEEEYDRITQTMGRKSLWYKKLSSGDIKDVVVAAYYLGQDEFIIKHWPSCRYNDKRTWRKGVQGMSECQYCHRLIPTGAECCYGCGAPANAKPYLPAAVIRFDQYFDKQSISEFSRMWSDRFSAKIIVLNPGASFEIVHG